MKTTYLAYAQDQFIEITRYKTKQIKFSALKCLVQWFPEADSTTHLPEQMDLL